MNEREYIQAVAEHVNAVHRVRCEIRKSNDIYTPLKGVLFFVIKGQDYEVVFSAPYNASWKMEQAVRRVAIDIINKISLSILDAVGPQKIPDL